MQEETLLQVLLPYRFTLFSNAGGGKTDYLVVLLPYRFTLFSNRVTVRYIVERVLLPYRFTLFSNKYNSVGKPFVFYYLIDLHYSQTIQQCKANTTTFYYLIDLHYSQT